MNYVHLGSEAIGWYRCNVPYCWCSEEDPFQQLLWQAWLALQDKQNNHDAVADVAAGE